LALPSHCRKKNNDDAGRNLITGLPESIEVSSIEIREALVIPLNQIIDAIKTTLDETPPELVADLLENGIALAGGGALLGGLANRLTRELKIRVYVADDPLTCVVRGGGIILEELDVLRNLISSPRRSPKR
jgi:rod shape-determining protein MreB